MGQDNIIELNGKRYDATTGMLLGESNNDIVEPLPPRPKNIDGVVRSGAKPKPHPEHDTTTHAEPVSKPKPHPKVDRKPPAPVKPHHPQHAKTLMRRSVTKPKTTLKPAMKPHAPAEVMAKPVSTLAMKHSVKHVDPVRMHRAQATPKSGSVQRFNPNQSPDNQPTYHHKPARTKSTGQTTNHPTAAPQPPPDLFEAAIAKATSHEEPAHKPKTKKKRGVSIMAGVAAFLILGGFLAYLNMANIQLRVASFQAGFTAHMPDYNPTGYDLTDIKNEHGKITLSYRSGESSYHISQQTTNWNSQTLGDDIIASAGNKTVQSKGRTIYFYDDTASWVSGGVRYDVTGNAHLSPDVVVDIATSM